MFFNKKVQGLLEYYELTEWWLNSFNNEERKIIEDIYKPMGSDLNTSSLTRGAISFSSQSKMAFLTILTGWFNNSKNRPIANIIMQKAEECLEENTHSILDQHFLYSKMISLYYPQREDKHMLDRAIEACKKQITIALKAKETFINEKAESQAKLLMDSKDPIYKDLKIWNGEEYVLLKNYNFDNSINTFKLPSHKGYETTCNYFKQTM